MSAPLQPSEFGEAGVAVYDSAGRAHLVPYRPDGAYLDALRDGAAARDARRPLDEILDEIGVAGGQLDELERAFTQPSR